MPRRTDSDRVQARLVPGFHAGIDIEKTDAPKLLKRLESHGDAESECQK